MNTVIQGGISRIGVMSPAESSLLTPNATDVRADWSLTVLPYAMYKYLTRKGIGASYLLSDIVLKENLSQEDLAQLFYLNGPAFGEDTASLMGYGCQTGVSDINRFQISGNDVLNAKIRNAINWSFSKSVKDRTDAMLMGPKCADAGHMEPVPGVVAEENPVYSEASPPYEFLVTGPKIWLTVKSGFLALLKNPVSRLQFYRDYLATIGKVAPQSAVTATTVFAHYVKQVVGCPG